MLRYRVRRCLNVVYLCQLCESKIRRLAFQISVLRQNLVIICASRAGANLGVLAFKIRVLRQKLVIICATRAGANFRVLAFKVSVLRPDDLDIVSV